MFKLKQLNNNNNNNTFVLVFCMWSILHFARFYFDYSGNKNVKKFVSFFFHISQLIRLLMKT